MPVTERLRRHAREQPWWLPGIWADVAELPGYAEVMAEERAQILALRPVHNVNFARCRAAGHEMDGNGRCVPCRNEYNAGYRQDHPHWAVVPGAAREAHARVPARRRPSWMWNASRRLNRRSGPRSKDSATDAGGFGPAGYALLPPIGHTGGETGHTRGDTVASSG
ncbi:MAG TPA: hypothetical protein VHN16_02260 [Streptosporangiaceae bacterium]|nr:hypothetical protein [Streptosporangiaceae bacterium]